MRTALFWAITQQVVAIPYQFYRTTYWSHLQWSRIQEERSSRCNTNLNFTDYQKYLELMLGAAG